MTWTIVKHKDGKITISVRGLSSMVEYVKLIPICLDNGSAHFRMQSNTGGYVAFGIMNGEMSAYEWNCPFQGRKFLKRLENYAIENNLRLTIPTVLNPKLRNILMDNGYTTKEVPYMDDVVELWSKDKN